MGHSQPARTGRNPRFLVAGVVVIAAFATIAAPGHHFLPPSSVTPASATHVPHSEHLSAPGAADGIVPGRNGRALGQADGVVPDGTAVFDDDVPAVAKLDPALLAALRQATTAAGDDGVALVVDSGWRSPAYQEQLLWEAVSEYGSEEEAARWVATPETSAHVSGDAVDIGPAKGAAWLSTHGARYGLCQIYRNEPWHYELRPEAVAHGCPRMYADPTQDPRMQS
jgi:D-alanyl-D-alanine carboxypeptidase